MTDTPHTPPSEQASPDHPDAAAATPAEPAEPADLDAIERDLAAVDVALQRLSDGTYWTDEVTGEPLAEHILAADPTARRA